MKLGTISRIVSHGRTYELSGQTLAGSGTETQVSRYNANGQLIHQSVLKSDNAAKYDVDYTATQTSPGGYDNAGNLLGYTLTSHEGDGATTTYVNTFTRAEGYQQTRVDASGSQVLPGATVSSYDVNGHLQSVTDTTLAAKNRSFVNDANGTALYASQTGHNQRQLVVNGEVLGRYGQLVDQKSPVDADGNPVFVPKSEFSFGYQAIGTSYPAGAPSQHAVVEGETLQSIAKGAYGDASLWYLIAEANGLGGSADLKVGQVLTIPARVASANNASSFKPYDPGQVVGDTSPYTAAKPQDEGGGCGVIGQIAVVIVTAAVAYFTGVYIGAESWGGFAAAAAVGSVAGQAVGVAIGAQDDFSWKQVALAAVSAGVTQGISGVDFTGNAMGNVIVRSAIANAATQGVGVVTGLQDEFSWKQVAASAAGAGVGASVGQGLYNAGAFNSLGSDFATGLARGTVSGFAAGLTTSALRGGKISVAQVATDAFGNALGSSIAAANGQSSGNSRGQQEDRLGDFIAQNQQSWDTRAAAYDQIVGAFSEPGGSRFAGVQLAAGPGYSGMGAGSDRDQNIDRMRDLANRPESGGTWSSMGTDGVPHVGFGVFGPDESIRSDDGRGFIDEVRSAAEGSINQGSAMGTPLPPSPYRWVSNELVDGDLVRGHWADAPQNARPGDSIRALSDSEAFFAFNPLGRMLGGVGTGLENMAKGVVNLGQQAVLTASDAIGTGMYGLNNALGGRRMDYTLDSALGRSFQTQGFGPTALGAAGGVMRGLASPITGTIGALYRQDPREFGENLPGLAAMAAPMLRGGSASGGLGLVEIDPLLIRTTQTTVKQQGATIPKLVESMKRDGFVVEPDRLIDIVRMPDGGLTSLDNTRILAAQRAGVNIQARVFDHSDLLPNDLDYVSRFIGRKNEVPVTYGDAVKNRIGNQSSAFRNLYPNGSPYIGSAY